MSLALPKNKWIFILIVNLIWWSVPFGMIFDMEVNRQDWSTPGTTDGDSLGIVVVPVFGIWLILWIALNVFLFLKRKRYPAGASLLAWDSTKKNKSVVWTVVCATFVFLYIYAIERTISDDISNHTFTSWVYLSMFGYILCSFWMRAFLVTQSE
jgi:hypothetical protein